MKLKELHNKIEELNNELEYINAEIKRIFEIKGIKYSEISVDKLSYKDTTIDKFIKEEELFKRKLIIEEELNNLINYEERELKRLSKYNETTKLIVHYKEDVIIHIDNKFRPLTWNEIAKKVYCSKATARRLYNNYLKNKNEHS